MSEQEIIKQFPYDPKFLKRVKRIRKAIIMSVLAFGGIVLCLLAMGFIATLGKIGGF